MKNYDKYGHIRHMNPQLRALSDERLEELVEKQSEEMDEQRYKAEAWDKMYSNLSKSLETMKNYKNENDVTFLDNYISFVEVVLEGMDDVLEEVKADDEI